METHGSIVVYQAKGGKAEVDVRLENETVWLTQQQIAKLFGTQRPAITKHLSNIFKANELKKNSVCSILEHTASDGKIYRTKYYNLDAIVSVGYRVNSSRATQFRIWATSVLKEYLINGYVLNERRLREQAERFGELQKAIALMGRTKEMKELDYREAVGLLDILRDYSYALGLLDDYDNGRLRVAGTTKSNKFRITYENARQAIGRMKERLGGTDIFGIEKDRSFRSSVAAIYQTFDGRELYPSVEEKAASLLYFIIKNHSFVDGNKRIAAAIFLWFLEGHGLLYRQDGSKRLADNALVALTLMIAKSKPFERKVIVTLVVNLINAQN